MTKEYGFVKLLKKKEIPPQLKKYVFKKKVHSSEYGTDPYRRVGNSPPVHNKQPYEAVLTNEPSWNPWEHKHPSEIYDDDFTSHDGVFLTLLDVDAGTKSKGKTGNLFGF